MTQWVLTQNYVPLAKRGGVCRHPWGWWGAEGGRGGRSSRFTPSHLGRRTGAASECRGWGEEELGEENHWEASDVKITRSPSQALLSRRRLTPGPRRLQPTQALRRLPSQITLIALQIVSRIRCSFQLNRRLSISILFGEFKWCAYSYRQPGYGVRKGVAIARSGTKSSSAKSRNQREWLKEHARGWQPWKPLPWWRLTALARSGRHSLMAVAGPWRSIRSTDAAVAHPRQVPANLLLPDIGHPHPRSRPTMGGIGGAHPWGMDLTPLPKDGNLGRAVLRLLPGHRQRKHPTCRA